MTATAPQTLPLDIALQQAIAHHEAGRLEEAEQLYRAILQAQPDNQDANHNLGVLAGQVGRHADGLPYLKAALEANPAEKQYWLSYAEALLATGQAGESLNIIATAIQRGINTPEVQSLRQRAESTVPNVTTKEVAPSHAELNQLVALFSVGRYAELEDRASLLVERHPDSGIAWKILGASLQAQGKKSLSALQKAAELLPDDAETHNNFGVALRGFGQFDAAVASYAKALEINPNYAEAHANLGNAMQALGKLDGAVESYRRALEIKPDYADALNNLERALKDIEQRGRTMDKVVVPPAIEEHETLKISLPSSEHIPFAKLWLMLACFIVYAGFFNNPVVFDDHNMFDSKTMLQSYDEMSFFNFSIRWLPYKSFVWTYNFFGKNIVWHRVINLCLHMAVVLALYAFIKSFVQSVLSAEENAQSLAARSAFWGALIFAVHPVAVYGAGYLIQRTIIMATLFSILALYAFVKGLSGEGQKWFFIAMAWYLIAVFSKEHAVMLPLAMVAIVPLVRRDYRVLARKLAVPFLMLFGIALLMALKRLELLGTVYEPNAMDKIAQTTVGGVQAVTVENRYFLSILLQSYLFFKYLLLWLVPNVGWMSADMQQKFPHALLQWPESVAFLIFITYPIVSGLLLWRGGRRGLLGFALLFPWLMFMTELSTVRIVEPFILYRSYLWMVCLPFALPSILGKFSLTRENMVLTLIVVALVPLSWNRLSTFSSDFKVWDDVVRKLPEEKVPGMFRAYLNRAGYHMQSASHGAAEALADLDKAVELNPREYAVYYNRGTQRLNMSRFLDGYEDLNHAIEINPNKAEAYFNRGLAQLNMGNTEKAIDDISYAVNLRPDVEHYKTTLDKLKK